MAYNNRTRFYVDRAREWDTRARRARAEYDQVIDEKTHEYMNRRHDPVDKFSAQYRAAQTTQAQAAAQADQMYTRWSLHAAQMALMEMAVSDHRFGPTS